MLIHLVCWKYKPETNAASRDLHRDMLGALSSLIDKNESLDVGEDVLHLDRSFDTGLVIRFENREALDRYTNHPEHQKVAAFGKEISKKVVSVDFFTDNSL